MRNQVVITVSSIKGHIVAHFAESLLTDTSRPTMNLSANQNTTTEVRVPEKLQGIDYNLQFPLYKAKSVDQIDYSEIEAIMIVNGVAHNICSINPKTKNNGPASYVDYLVVFNTPEQSIAA